jgi:ATP-dependent Clp protease ATP-binding subunit ClpC
LEVDTHQLRQFGTLLTDPAQLARLPHAHRAEEAVEAVLRSVRATPPQAVVLLGDSGTGKTAIVHEIAHRLAPQGWHLLQVTPADFLTGTVYLGEWQTRLKKLLDAIRAPLPVILYLPNLDELNCVGRSSSSDANVATAIASEIERGNILVLGESTKDAFQRGLGATPALRKLFQAVAVKPVTEVTTRAILAEVADELGANIAPPVVDRLCELAEFSSASAALPGRAVELLRRVVAALPTPDQPISASDILSTIRTSTGIPLELVDDTVKLDRAAVRRFFDMRVMGQPEGVDAAVDLVTLIKAGLTDPQKPFGVLLFVGPTGVGKTELARALAEFCFGNANRLVRLDMSEFATYEAYERLIGHTGSPGLLTSIVREQPFSILLLDELEKGHANIFDLCLQIFDAGRLTDGQGRTADFRRTIIILTSNVGAGMPQEGPIGFGQTVSADVSMRQSQRDLRRAFRPEFLNRIDRIVEFRPLSEETAEKIARREVARVLERSGIKRRNLAIDSDPLLMPLLLREGYSRAYGARPLKRAIERLVLLPLARAIAAGEINRNSLVRLIVRNDKVHVQIVQEGESDAPETPQPAPAPNLDVMTRLARLAAGVARFREQAADLSAKKGALLTRTAAADFWENPRQVREIYDQIFVLDGVLTQIEHLAAAVERVEERVGGRFAGDGARLGARLDEIESRAAHLEVLLCCRDPRLLGDCIVTVSLVPAGGVTAAARPVVRSDRGVHPASHALPQVSSAINAVERLAQMYARLARRHQFAVEVLDDHRIESPLDDSISLLISGVGPFALLAGEAGLHAFYYGTGGDSRQSTNQREVARVEVSLVDNSHSPIARPDVHVEIHPLGKVAGRLLRRPKFDVRLLHPSSLMSIRAWTDSDESTAVTRLLPLLEARVASRAASNSGNGAPDKAMIRRYRLGPSQLVRDVRTGRRTGRLDQILNGHLDPFLVPLSSDDPTSS